jgi:hypothetical protein
MSLDTTVPRSRRALLGAAIGAAAATVVSAIERPARVRAGSDGDVVLAEVNHATAETAILKSGSDVGAALWCANDGAGAGVTGDSVSGVGVSGYSIHNTGVFGSSDEGSAVYSYGPKGVGVTGATVTGTGIVGSADTGVGGHFKAAVGTALRVDGKARFSRSKRVTIRAGRSSRKVTLAGVTTASLVFAVLHSNRSGYYVRAVVPASGYFTIYLNKALTSATYVAYFVVN